MLLIFIILFDIVNEVKECNLHCAIKLSATNRIKSNYRYLIYKTGKRKQNIVISLDECAAMIEPKIL